MLCMVPRELCSLAAVVQHQHDSLGSCVRGPATASTSSTMPAPCWHCRRRGRCSRTTNATGPSGVVLARRRRTTPARLPWELRSWSCYSVHVVYNASTRAWSLGSCAAAAAVVVRRFTHANLKSTSSGTIPPSPGSCWQRNV